MISITYTCPNCGIIWTEDRRDDDHDDSTMRTQACERCAKRFIKQLQDMKRNQVWNHAIDSYFENNE